MILLHCKRATLSPTVSRLHHLKLECSVKRSAVIGSYNIQGSQSQRGCVASASKIPSEYTTSVASTKNDNTLAWPAIQFQMKNSWNIHVYIWDVSLLIVQNWTGPYILFIGITLGGVVTIRL